MSNKQESNIPWWAIVLGFILFWPVGMVLLFLNLGGVVIPTDRLQQDLRQGYDRFSQDQQRRQTPPPQAAQSGYQGQRTTQGPASFGAAPAGAAKAGQGAAQRSYTYGGAPAGPQRAQPQSGAGKRWRFRKPKSGKSLTFLGGLISFCTLIPLVDELSSYGLAFWDTWFPLFGFFCAGLAMAWTGLSRTRFGRRQRLYMGVIGNRNSVFISDLAGSAGVSEKKVLSDLQKMLSDGTLPMGYIDRASGRLVLTDQGYEAPRREEAPAREAEKPKAQPKEDEDDAILRQIKAVNDAIPDDEMSRKIDRIGEITGKILDYQRQNPAKAAELRQFLNYYLPTTLKLLRTYAQLESQGVEGENISAAKERIEGMMDKVVEGFEKQLDQLFRTEAMDIATDVEVLERMLDKDGLGSGMTMGG